MSLHYGTLQKFCEVIKLFRIFTADWLLWFQLSHIWLSFDILIIIALIKAFPCFLITCKCWQCIQLSTISRGVSVVYCSRKYSCSRISFIRDAILESKLRMNKLHWNRLPLNLLMEALGYRFLWSINTSVSLSKTAPNWKSPGIWPTACTDVCLWTTLNPRCLGCEWNAWAL